MGSVASRIERLTKELDRLHRGRGIHAPGLLLRLGPTLSAVIFEDGEPVAIVARQVVRQRLVSAAETLPPDVRRVFLAALGITDGAAILTERLENVGRALDRGVRTMKRRLHDANASVALVLERRSRAGEDDNPFAARGWYVLRLESHAYLGSQPRFVGVRDIKVTQEGLSRLCESFSVPRHPGEDQSHEVLVEPTEGCDRADVERFSASTWRLNIQLPRAFSVGETHRVGVSVTWPSLAYIRPYNVIVPLRETKSFLASVTLGEGTSVTQAWRYDGVPPAAIDDAIPTGRMLRLARDSPVTIEWPSVRRGFAYGIGWS